jgi:hypothetical protein
MVWRIVFFEEVSMYKIETPVIIIPTAEAKHALGHRLYLAGVAAHREIAMAAKGLEIGHLQFAFFELTLAICSRIRRNGVVEIEIGLGNPSLPSRSFTATQIREAMAAAAMKAKAAAQRSARLR